MNVNSVINLGLTIGILVVFTIEDNNQEQPVRNIMETLTNATSNNYIETADTLVVSTSLE